MAYVFALIAAAGWWAWYMEMSGNTRVEAWRDRNRPVPLSETPAVRRAMEWRPAADERSPR